MPNGWKNCLVIFFMSLCLCTHLVSAEEVAGLSKISTPEKTACQKYKDWQPTVKTKFDLSVFSEVIWSLRPNIRQDSEKSILVSLLNEGSIDYPFYLKIAPQVCTALVLQEIKNGKSKIETFHIVNASGYQGFTLNDVHDVCDAIEKTEFHERTKKEPQFIGSHSVEFTSPCEPPASSEPSLNPNALLFKVTPENERIIKSKAREECEKDVRTSATYTSAANFTLFGWETQILGNLINVRGQVELLNSFGAKLPHRFYCKYQITNGGRLQEVETMVYPD